MFRYRTISAFQRASQTLRLCFFYWQVLASFVFNLVFRWDSARILGEFHSIRRFLSPTYLASHKSPRQGAVRPVFDTGPAYAIALRVMATISCPSIKRILLYRFDYMFFSRFTLLYLFCRLASQERLALRLPTQGTHIHYKRSLYFPLSGDTYFLLYNLFSFSSHYLC